jgi:hypothetical protein
MTTNDNNSKKIRENVFDSICAIYFKTMNDVKVAINLNIIVVLVISVLSQIC